MKSKIAVAAAIALSIYWYFQKPQQEFKAAQSKPTFLENSGQDPVDPRKGPGNGGVLMLQRKTFDAELRLGVMQFQPSIRQDSFDFSWHYSDIKRHCVDGDIDLIARYADPKSELLWSWEHADGKPLVKARQIPMERLAEPFSQAIRIPLAKSPRYYRLALCINPGQRDCADVDPVDFQNLEKNGGKIRSGLLSAQYFRVDDKVIRVFDSREFSDANLYRQYAKSTDGNDDAYPFLERMLNAQKLLGSLPIEIGRDRLDVHLFSRIHEGC